MLNINFLFKVNDATVINLNELNSVILIDLLVNSHDINDCITNCSNNGICEYNSLNNNYKCNCFPAYSGSSCETIKNPCISNNQCLNNSTCVYVSSSIKLFECKCNSNIYYGPNCESQVDLCLNQTCSKNGVCKMDEQKLKAYCSCFKYYSGEDCGIKSGELKAVEAFISISSIVSIILITVFYLMFIINDVIDKFICKLKIKIKNKRMKSVKRKSLKKRAFK